MCRIAVRHSPIHGRGVFALKTISKGDQIFEYKGQVVSAKEAQRRYERSSVEDGHTFFFGLDDARMIDGTHGGNSGRWINHSCEPNCETEEEGNRVFIRAGRTIHQGDKLFLTVDSPSKAGARGR